MSDSTSSEPNRAQQTAAEAVRQQEEEEAIDPFKIDQETEDAGAAAPSYTSTSQDERPLEDDDQGFNTTPHDYKRSSANSQLQQQQTVAAPQYDSATTSTSASPPPPPPPPAQAQATPSSQRRNDSGLPPLPVPNIDLSDIRIVDAIKTSDGPASKSYIAYVIRSGSHQATHRYSTFSHLRSALIALHPTLIIPPIPDKESLTEYAAKGVGVGLTKSREDPELIKRRKRMLESFLRRCAKHNGLKDDSCFLRFLEGRLSWYEIQTSPPLTHLPKNLLRTSISNPASPNRPLAYSSLPLPSGSDMFNVPVPSSSSATAGLSLSSTTVSAASGSGGSHGPTLKVPNQRFLDSEAFTNRFANHVKGALEKVNNKIVKKWSESSADYGELGAELNRFALWLSDAGGLASAVEMTGKAADATFLASGELLTDWESQFTEPLHEYSQFAGVLQRLLKFRHLKHAQLEMAQETLLIKKGRLEELERVENEARRLDRALERGGRGLVRGENASSSSSSMPAAPTSHSRDASGSIYGSAAGDGLAPSNDDWHRRSLYGSAAEDESSDAWNNRDSQSNPNPNGVTTSNLNDGRDFIPQASPSASHQPATHVTARTLNSAPSHHVPVPRSSSSTYSGLLGAITHTFQSVMDTDPEATRRNNIAKLRDQINLLEEAVELSTEDLRLATAAIQADLDRFQRQKVADMRDMMLNLAKAHRDFCQANLNSWQEAKDEISKIKPSTRPGGGEGTEMPVSRLNSR